MKSIILKQIISIIFILLFFSNCDFEWLAMDKTYGIFIQNNSIRAIYACADYILPDTILPVEKLPLTLVSPDEQELMYARNFNDEKLKRLKRGDVLTVFILDKNIVDGNSWDSIRINNMVLRRLEYNKDMKWIYYP